MLAWTMCGWATHSLGMHTDHPQNLAGTCIAVCVGIMAAATDLAAQGERYVAYFGDGSTLSGPALDNTFGWSYSTNAPTVGKEPLSRGSAPLRYLRDTGLRATLTGPYLVFANGDILPGRVIRVDPADPLIGQEKRMVVNLSPPLTGCDISGTEVEVRIDRLSRVVSDHARKRDLRPGTLWLKDGRVIEFRAVRWSAEGLRALTEEGIVKASYADLEEYHASAVDPVAAIMEDLATPCPVPGSPLVRTRISNGAALTCREALFIEAGWSHIAVKPPWSLSGICFGTGVVVSRGFRSPLEVPLSLLRCELLEERSFTGFLWPWRRHTNVRGGELRSGSVAAALGIGTHALNALAFDLPAGASTFTSWVGLDQAVGPGGCVRCSVFGDDRNGKPLWQSGHLRGLDPVAKVSLKDIRKCKRLVLVTEFGHEGRPEGADPLDIRDEVNWIEPTIELAKVPVPEARTEASRVLAQLGEWDVPAGAFESPVVVPAWRWGSRRCTEGIYAELPKSVRLKRQVAVSLTNAWLEISVGRGRRGGDGHKNGHTITVLADGRPQHPINTYHACTTTNLLSGHLRVRQWGLGGFAGREVNLEVAIDPVPRGSTREFPGLVLEGLYLGPVVDGLSGDGADITRPAVPITSVKPRKVTMPTADAKLQPGKLANGHPLRICGYLFEDGYGVPAGSELTYGLDPAWKRFVAVIGMNREVAVPPEEGGEISYEMGPFLVRLDGKPHWQSTGPATFNLWDRARQIDVEIPPGHKSITLQVQAGDCYAVWAGAGFMTD